MPVAEREAPPQPFANPPAARHRRPLRWLMLADGTSIHTRRFAAALHGAGVDVHLAAYTCDPRLGCVLHDLGERPRGDPRRTARVIRRLRSLVHDLEPDVLNPHYVSGYGLLAAVAGHRQVVQTAWGSDLLIDARGVRGLAVGAALRRARLATGDSDDLLTALRARAPRLPCARFVFGPPQALFTRPRDPRRIILSPRAHEAIYRIDLVLDAWRLAAAQVPDHRLVVAGAGSLTGRLQTRAGQRVEFTGQLEHDALLDYFLRADLTVSVPRSDASSASVLEALAARSGVLASDLPANREWLPARCLIRVDAGPEELAEAMVRGVRSEPITLDPMWAIERQAAVLVQLVQASQP